jgi:hypothetical protein
MRDLDLRRQVTLARPESCSARRCSSVEKTLMDPRTPQIGIDDQHRGSSLCQ